MISKLTPYLAISLIAFFVFYPSIQLSFYGDDWLIFRIDKYFHGSGVISSWNYFRHFLTLYGSQVLTMGILKKIFGFNPTWFYLVSFLLRLFMVFSLVPLARYLIKDKLAVLYALLFLSITPIGLETTEYLPHMTSYISFGFFNLFLYLFLKSREISTRRLLALSAAFFYLTFVFAPARMTGIIPFVVSLEIFWFIQKGGRAVLNKIVFRLLIIFIVFLFIIVSGNPFFSPSYPDQEPTVNPYILNQFKNGIDQTLNNLQQEKYGFLFFPAIALGNMFLPSYLAAGFHSSLIRQFLIPAFLGGGFLISSLYLIIKFHRNTRFATALFISFSWAIFAFIIPWIWAPNTVFPTIQRYLIGSSIAIALFVSTLLTLIRRKARVNKTLVVTVFVCLLFIQVLGTKQYLGTLFSRHNQKDFLRIWSQVPYIQEIFKGKEPVIFYFEYEGINAGKAHDILEFGFGSHMDIIYNLNDPKGNIMPRNVNSFESLITIHRDEKSSLDHIYGFRLSGENTLINITTMTRDKLSKINENNE